MKNYNGINCKLKEHSRFRDIYTLWVIFKIQNKWLYMEGTLIYLIMFYQIYIYFVLKLIIGIINYKINQLYYLIYNLIKFIFINLN